MEERDTDSILKCHKCIRVIWKDAKAGLPDIQKTREESCSKAFYVSQGNRRQWLRDVCFFDKEVLFTDLSDPEVVLTELQGIVRKGRMALNRAERYQADEGGVLTPDFIRMTNQVFTHAKTLYLLEKGIVAGPGGNLTNARQIAPPSGQGGGKDFREQLLGAIFNAEDGYEDSPTTTTTKATVQQGDRSVTVEKTVVAAPSPAAAGGGLGGAGGKGAAAPADVVDVDFEEPEA